ncbi:MAG: hypothetical protein QOG65_2305 [Actinomycetota bacterium]|nr:hypothetical protein [Actinomycetota bacterium]
MVARSADRRLAQWMLDVGTPATQVFDVLASTAGLVQAAEVVRALEAPTERRLPVVRRREFERAELERAS